MQKDGPLTAAEVAELDSFGELEAAMLLGLVPWPSPRAMELWEREIIWGRVDGGVGGLLSPAEGRTVDGQLAEPSVLLKVAPADLGISVAAGNGKDASGGGSDG